MGEAEKRENLHGTLHQIEEYKKKNSMGVCRPAKKFPSMFCTSSFNVHH